MERQQEPECDYRMVLFPMTLNDLTKYSMTRSIVRSLCDTLAACENRCRVYAFDNDICIKYRFTDATVQKIVQQQLENKAVTKLEINMHYFREAMQYRQAP